MHPIPPGRDVYVGEWRSGQREGKGVLSLASGDRFCTNWSWVLVLHAPATAHKQGWLEAVVEHASGYD